MTNKLLSLIGSVAIGASAAYGQGSVTNAPALLAPQKVVSTERDTITLSATNFNNGAKFSLYKSTNLVDWTRVPYVVFSGYDPTSRVTRSYFEDDSAFRKNAKYKLRSD